MKAVPKLDAAFINIFGGSLSAAPLPKGDCCQQMVRGTAAKENARTIVLGTRHWLQSTFIMAVEAACSVGRLTHSRQML